MAINTFFPCNYRYPYTNDHELNLGWVLATIKAQESELSKFVALNTVKYADPFDWNITSQYSTNTVVFNPADMTAYISVQPVPSGVQIDNTDYWTPIFTLADIFTAYKTSITPVEQIAAKPATQAISKGQLIWIDNVLYQAVRDIAQETVIVPGENVLLTNISDELAAHEAAITAEQEAREQADTQLQASITTEQSAREQADQLLQTNITAEQSAREQSDTQLQSNITAEQTAREQQYNNITRNVKNVKFFGAKGDGVTDDTSAIQLALNTGGTIFFDAGTYRITSTLKPVSNSYIFGPGKIYFDGNSGSAFSCIYDGNTKNNIYIVGLYITGNTRTEWYGLEAFQEPSDAENISNIHFINCRIENASRGINTFAGRAGEHGTHSTPDIHINGCYIKNIRGTAICNSGTQVFIENCYIFHRGETEAITVDSGCQRGHVVDTYIVANCGGAGAISVDECYEYVFSGLHVYQNNSKNAAFRFNCQSGSCDNMIISNSILVGGTYSLSFGNSNYYAQIIASNISSINSKNATFYSQNAANILFISNSWIRNNTESETTSLTGTVFASNNLYKT